MRNRLDRVRQLLVSTDLTVQQIATLCGFSRAENLIRFFRDAYGIPPSAYRLKYGTANPRSVGITVVEIEDEQIRLLGREDCNAPCRT